MPRPSLSITPPDYFATAVRAARALNATRCDQDILQVRIAMLFEIRRSLELDELASEHARLTELIERLRPQAMAAGGGQ